MTYTELLSESPVVFVEFFASWCPHCQRMMPVVAQIKELLEGRALVAQFDIDENRELASEQEVESIPTFIIYQNGVEKWRRSGEIDGETLLSQVESYL